MIKKYTIKDEVVVDSLYSLSQLEESLEERKIAVAGGIANQIYTQQLKEYLRPTNDIDLATWPFLDREEFNKMASYIVDALREMGYLAYIGPKKHNNYEIRVKDDDNELLIHFDRFSKKYFERVGELELEKIKSAKGIEFELNSYQNFTIYILRPEHVLNGKVKRLKRASESRSFTNDEKEIYKYILNLDFDKLSEYKILPMLDELIEERDILTLMEGTNNEKFYERLIRYKIEKDIYDICLLSKVIVAGLVEFDKDYYNKIRKETEKRIGTVQTTIEDFF